MSRTISINLRKHADGQRIFMRIDTFDTESKDAIDSSIILKADEISVFIDSQLPNALDQSSPVRVWQDAK